MRINQVSSFMAQSLARQADAHLTLLRRLQSGGVGPFLQVSGCIGLTCLGEKGVALWAGWKRFGPLANLIGPGRQPVTEG